MNKVNKLTKGEKSWVFYDWANSVYATIIMSAVFPIYFSNIAKSAGFSGDVFWGYATSIATFLVAIAAPFLGAIGDFKGMKKKLLTIFMLVGVVFTLLMAITDQPMLMLIGYGISYVGFAGANLFYDSFLTDVTTNERMDRVSAYGYAMGYLGGSTIPFIISIALVMFGSKIGIDGTMAVKLSVVLTSLWWAGFSIPILLNVKQTHHVETPPSKLAAHAMKNLGLTIKSIVLDRRLAFFILAYFFYIDGVGTIIHMATSYGSTLGLGSVGMILALLVTQIVAVPCSILFSKFSAKIGTIRMLCIGIGIYMVVCMLGFYMGFSLEPKQFAYEESFSQVVDANSAGIDSTTLEQLKTDGLAILSNPDRAEQFTKLVDTAAAADGAQTEQLTTLKTAAVAFLSNDANAKEFDDALDFSAILFWILATLVGTSQGGIQALSRSFFGKLIPAERSNEYFGFFDIFGKFAAVMGPALYALFASLTGRSSIGILSLILLFAIGGTILITQRRHFEEKSTT